MRSYTSRILLGATAVAALPVGQAFAANILSPSDFIIAIDANRNRPGNTNVNNPDGSGEGPSKAFDNTDNTKWLTFGRAFTGLIVTPAGGPVAVKSLSFTTANDSPNRDPISYQLYGTNGSVTTANNGTGLEDSWTLIGSGLTNIAPAGQAATARNTTALPSDVANNTAYSSYKVVFPSVRMGDAAANTPTTPNSLQLSELRMFDGPAGTGTNVAVNPTAAVAFDQTDSFYPATQQPSKAIDGQKTAASKYLNFGREGAGLIITPAAGPKVVDSFQITTGGDAPGRDPASYELWGTNDAITSLDNSAGDSENWILIASGPLTLPGDPAVNTDQRLVDGPVATFSNTNAYSSYKFIFPENKDDVGNADSIQFSEIALFEAVPEPTSLGLLGAAAVGMLGRRRRRA